MTLPWQIFTFNDRKEARLLLAPTHEEEITTLVGSLVKSYKDLPLRVYQICQCHSLGLYAKVLHTNISITARKYRDEPRPRQGLLRGREFIMKDLYTFDHSVEAALETYQSVKVAYTQLFNELKIPYMVAAADSGNMGGSLSHEFHFPSSKGEDTVVSCSSCGHVYNEELADGISHGVTAASSTPEHHPAGFATKESSAGGTQTVSTDAWMAISKDKTTLLRGWYPKFSMQEGSGEPVEREINSHAVKSIASAAGVDLDLGVENPLEQWVTHIKTGSVTQRPRVLDIYDAQVRVYQRPPLSDLLQNTGYTANDIEYTKLDQFPGTTNGLSIVKVNDGDQCPKCAQGVVKTDVAVELGHTFHLGTRYSEVLSASVMVDTSVNSSSASKDQLVPMQMGCHGIGVSRMITAVADRLADAKGLNWPRVMAPYEVVIVPSKGLEAEAEKIYDLLASPASGSASSSGSDFDLEAPVDTIIDDRDKQMGWKLGDADLIGYPVIIVVGKGWKKQQTLEVQCRQLHGLKEDVPLEQLSGYVRSLLQRL